MMRKKLTRTFKTRREEVLEDRNVRRYASYVLIDEKNLSSLRTAFNEGDESTMFDVLKSQSAFDVNANLMNTYTDLIVEMAKKVLDANAHRLGAEGKRDARQGAYRPTVPPPRERKKKTYDTVSQSDRRGKRYTRDKPVEFSKREQTFMRNNINLNNKDFVKLYNNYLPKRSSSSIISKKYRLKKGRQKKNVRKKPNP